MTIFRQIEMKCVRTLKVEKNKGFKHAFDKARL